MRCFRFCGPSCCKFCRHPCSRYSGNPPQGLVRREHFGEASGTSAAVEDVCRHVVLPLAGEQTPATVHARRPPIPKGPSPPNEAPPTRGGLILGEGITPLPVCQAAIRDILWSDGRRTAGCFHSLILWAECCAHHLFRVAHCSERSAKSYLDLQEPSFFVAPIYIPYKGV